MSQTSINFPSVKHSDSAD